MEIGTKVIFKDSKGILTWKDDPWVNTFGDNADILVKVTMTKTSRVELCRLSELQKDTEIIELEVKSEEPSTPSKELLDFKDFLEISSKLEIKFGNVLEAVKIPKSDKLLKLTVDFGEEKTRTVVTNLGGVYPAGVITSKGIFPFVTNLKPSKMMGVVSEAMILVPNLSNSVDLDPLVGYNLL